MTTEISYPFYGWMVQMVRDGAASHRDVMLLMILAWHAMTPSERAEGGLGPGVAVPDPTLDDLAKTFGVGRRAARRWVRRLESKGLARRVRDADGHVRVLLTVDVKTGRPAR